MKNSTTDLPFLVVNDDPTIQRLFRKKLERYGAESVRAWTGGKAIYKAKSHDFSATFLDLVLPDMDGIELYEKLLETESHYKLPVVFIADTGSRDELAVFNRLETEKAVSVISRSALSSGSDRIIPELMLASKN